MSYITNADIETRLGTAVYVQLADDTGTGSADVAIVDEARLGAEGEANSYLGRRYAVPVDLVLHPELGDVLQRFVLDLAAYRLHARRQPVPTDVVRQRDAAIAWFERAASGAVTLPSLAALAENTATGTVGEVSGDTRVLTRDELDGL